jgi:hypothetical protein
MKSLLSFLLRRVLILTGLFVASFTLPIASLWLVRDPIGAQG